MHQVTNSPQNRHSMRLRILFSFLSLLFAAFAVAVVANPLRQNAPVFEDPMPDDSILSFASEAPATQSTQSAPLPPYSDLQANVDMQTQAQPDELATDVIPDSSKKPPHMTLTTTCANPQTRKTRRQRSLYEDIVPQGEKCDLKPKCGFLRRPYCCWGGLTGTLARGCIPCMLLLLQNLTVRVSLRRARADDPYSSRCRMYDENYSVWIYCCAFLRPVC